MKRIVLTMAAAWLTLGLAACSQKQTTAAEKPAPAAPPAAAPTASGNGASMGGMAMSADAKMAKGTGTVTAVDATTGTITIDHQPIPEANWPAMKMAFKASPDLVKSVKAGDKVSFDLKLQGGSGEVTAIARQ
jgi:Cu/Ag efflux protein CusF